MGKNGATSTAKPLEVLIHQMRSLPGTSKPKGQVEARLGLGEHTHSVKVARVWNMAGPD